MQQSIKGNGRPRQTDNTGAAGGYRRETAAKARVSVVSLALTDLSSPLSSREGGETGPTPNRDPTTYVRGIPLHWRSGFYRGRERFQTRQARYGNFVAVMDKAWRMMAEPGPIMGTWADQGEEPWVVVIVAALLRLRRSCSHGEVQACRRRASGSRPTRRRPDAPSGGARGFAIESNTFGLAEREASQPLRAARREQHEPRGPSGAEGVQSTCPGQPRHSDIIHAGPLQRCGPECLTRPGRFNRIPMPITGTQTRSAPISGNVRLLKRDRSHRASRRTCGSIVLPGSIHRIPLDLNQGLSR